VKEYNELANTIIACNAMRDLLAMPRMEVLGQDRGLPPLNVPPPLHEHHPNRHPVPDWVHRQVYLHPYPKELMLRNHV
jgi:uncharacterized protein YbgA (DUF1722 family)